MFIKQFLVFLALNWQFLRVGTASNVLFCFEILEEVKLGIQTSTRNEDKVRSKG